MLARKRKRSISSLAYRLAPLGAFSGVGAVAVLDAHYILAVLCGGGVAFAGKRLLDREGNVRREISRRAKENVRRLRAVARQDRVAASQMERLISLQNGLLEGWELVPRDYHALLDEDIFTIVEEVEGAAWLARRRSALRDHLQNLDRRAIKGRIKSLKREIRDLPEGSALRATFESALAGREDELAGSKEMLDGISLINAQLEGAESLLGSLRGDLLTLDAGSTAHALDGGLARLKERVSLFKRSLDEVAYAVETIPKPHGFAADETTGHLATGRMR